MYYWKDIYISVLNNDLTPLLDAANELNMISNNAKSAQAMLEDILSSEPDYDKLYCLLGFHPNLQWYTDLNWTFELIDDEVYLIHDDVKCKLDVTQCLLNMTKRGCIKFLHDRIGHTEFDRKGIYDAMLDAVHHIDGDINDDFFANNSDVVDAAACYMGQPYSEFVKLADKFLSEHETLCLDKIDGNYILSESTFKRFWIDFYSRHVHLKLLNIDEILNEDYFSSYDFSVMHISDEVTSISIATRKNI